MLKNAQILPAWVFRFWQTALSYPLRSSVIISTNAFSPLFLRQYCCERVLWLLCGHMHGLVQKSSLLHRVANNVYVVSQGWISGYIYSTLITVVFPIQGGSDSEDSLHTILHEVLVIALFCSSLNIRFLPRYVLGCFAWVITSGLIAGPFCANIVLSQFTNFCRGNNLVVLLKICASCVSFAIQLFSRCPQQAYRSDDSSSCPIAYPYSPS